MAIKVFEVFGFTRFRVWGSIKVEAFSVADAERRVKRTGHFAEITAIEEV